MVRINTALLSLKGKFITVMVEQFSLSTVYKISFRFRAEDLTINLKNIQISYFLSSRRQL